MSEDFFRANGVVFHSRSNAKEVHFIHYKFTYTMYTRTGYKRRDIREKYRRNPEEYTIHQHHGINNINIKEEIQTMVAVQGADSGGRRGRRTSRRRGLDPEQDGSWKDWKKEGVMEGVSAPGWKNRRRLEGLEERRGDGRCFSPWMEE
jgi:hypothetical protein